MSGLPDSSNDQCGYDRANEIGEEVTAGVFVITDVCFRENQDREKFDDFIEGSETHSCGGADGKHPERWSNWIAVVPSHSHDESLPAQPRDESYPEPVDKLIIFQVSRDNAPIVKHARGIRSMPVIRNWCEPAYHVQHTPEAEPQRRLRLKPARL